MKRRSLISTAAALAAGNAAWLLPAPALATGGFAGATEPTQILNNIELAAQTIKQAQQHVTQITNMLTNIEKLKDAIIQAVNFNLSVLKPFFDLAGSLKGLGSSLQSLRGFSFSMSDMDARFRATFKGYTANPNMGAQYRDWSDAVNQTMESTMKGIELTSKEMEDETSFAQRLQDMASSADGRNQLEQTIIAFSNESIVQMQKLRTLMMMDMQSKLAYQGFMVNETLTQKANTEKAMVRSTSPQSRPGATPTFNP